MASELEGLIAALLLLISCGGEQGKSLLLWLHQRSTSRNCLVAWVLGAVARTLLL